MDSVRLNVILEMSGENNIDLCIFMKTTDLIHDLEMRRDSFIRLQQEGKEASSKFVTFEDLQNLEQVQKWTTSKVCQRQWCIKCPSVRKGFKKNKKKVVILLQPPSIYLPTPIGVQKATFLIFSSAHFGRTLESTLSVSDVML